MKEAKSFTHRPFPKSYKGCYPFSLSVPSFVYPDTWSVNARLAGPYVDEMELLFFDSRYENALPTDEEIDLLSQAADDCGLKYNVHLPTDISIASSNSLERERAVETVRRVIDMASKLNPTTWTLHIPYDRPGRKPKDVKTWQKNAWSGLQSLLESGMPHRNLSIETLDYPFEWVQDIVFEFDMKICMDVGHLLLRGEDITSFYRANSDRISIIHLHGVSGGVDHKSLAILPDADCIAIKKIIREFTGTLSIEVFLYEHLLSSMVWLESVFI